MITFLRGFRESCRTLSCFRPKFERRDIHFNYGQSSNLFEHNVIHSEVKYSFSKSTNEYPEHIAIIMDGNRRYAYQKSLFAWDGHEFGASTLEDLLRGIIDDRNFIEELTLFCFSTENFLRDDQEVSFLLYLFDKKLEELRGEEDIYSTSRIRFIGDLDLFIDAESDLGLSIGLIDTMNLIEDETRDNTGLKLNLCCGYGSRNEILSATKVFATEILEQSKDETKSIEELRNKINDLNETDLMGFLGLTREPNLVIRTGDRRRTSNFLAYQTVYSEWFFLEILWPEFTLEILDDVIDEYVHNRIITNGI